MLMSQVAVSRGLDQALAFISCQIKKIHGILITQLGSVLLLEVLKKAGLRRNNDKQVWIIWFLLLSSNITR